MAVTDDDEFTRENVEQTTAANTALYEAWLAERSIVSLPVSNTEENASLVKRLQTEADAMHKAPSGIEVGDTFHAFNWGDKPHRVLYDAVRLIREAATALVAADARMAEMEERLDFWHAAVDLEIDMRVTSEKRAETAETLLEEARKALEPFAEFANAIAEENARWDHDDFAIFLGDHKLTLAPFRRARTTLDRIGK